MNTKSFVLVLTVISTIWMSACSDDLNSVGGSIKPGEDNISVYTDTFQVQASTILLDSIYAKTTIGLLGEMYDPVYGYIKADYISQFYCMEDYTFAKTPVDGKIDSVSFFVLYSSFVGDSLTPMRAQVYQVTSPLEKNYYTNVNPDKFCDRSILLGVKTYTAHDMSISDSIRGITDTSDSLFYTPHIRIRLDKSLGQKIYDETIHNPSSFKNQAAFNAFLPGFYITTTFGTGNLINVSSSVFRIYYHYRDTLTASTGADSIVIKQAWESFMATPEVIQVNRVKHNGLENLLNDPDYVYMKTPSGTAIKLVIPAKEIEPLVEGRAINNMSFSLKAMPQEDLQFPMSIPSTLVVMPEDSLSFFFQKGYTDVNSLAILSTYTASTRKYSFGNISNLLKVHIKNNPGKDLNLIVLPVTRETGSASSSTVVTTSLSNLMAPSAVKVRRDKESMKIEVVSSKY